MTTLGRYRCLRIIRASSSRSSPRVQWPSLTEGSDQEKRVLAEGWHKATLAEKIPETVLRRGPRPVWNVLSGDAKGLNVEWEISAPQQWLQVRVRGDDAEAFLNLLVQKYGEEPVHHSKDERWDVLPGFITGSGRVGFPFSVHVRILQPPKKDPPSPLPRMRAQLAAL